MESAECEFGEGKETPEHFLLVRRKYMEAREILRKKVGLEGMKVKYLLGNKKSIEHTMEFIKSTARF